MIDPKQIPDEVVEALGAALGNTRPTWDYAEAIAAALNGWPEAWTSKEMIGGQPYLLLPLPKEKQNDKA